MVNFEITPKMELVATPDAMYKREGKATWYLLEGVAVERVS